MANLSQEEFITLATKTGIPVSKSMITPVLLAPSVSYTDGEYSLPESATWSIDVSIGDCFSTSDTIPGPDTLLDTIQIDGNYVNSDEPLFVQIYEGWISTGGSVIKWQKYYTIYAPTITKKTGTELFNYSSTLSKQGEGFFGISAGGVSSDSPEWTLEFPVDAFSFIRKCINMKNDVLLSQVYTRLFNETATIKILFCQLYSEKYFALYAQTKTVNYSNSLLNISDNPYVSAGTTSSSQTLTFWKVAGSGDFNPFVDIVNQFLSENPAVDDSGNSQNGSGKSGGGRWGGGYPSRYRKDQSNLSGWGSIPDLSAVGTGLVSLYSPTLTELKSLGEFLWSKDFFDNILKNYQSPLENIISLSIIPHFPVGSVDSTLSIGNVATEISAPKLSGQFIKYSLGSVSVDEFYRTFADYEPLEKLTLFLPFVGFTPLSTDDFMNGSLTVEYMIDLLSGSFVAGVIASGKGTQKLLYQYSGSLGYQIPLSGANFLSYFSQIATGAFSVARGAGQLISGNPASGVSDVINGGAQAIFAKPDYQRSGSISNGSSLLSQHCASVIFSTPQNTTAGGLGSVGGFVSNKWQSVGAYSGFTQFSSIKLEGITGATQDEMGEIARQLKEGVII